MIDEGERHGEIGNRRDRPDAYRRIVGRGLDSIGGVVTAMR